VSRYQDVFDYAKPYESELFELDPAGHAWDRLAAIAGEYDRGERTWDSAKALVDDTVADLAELLNQPKEGTA
jgi:hypothetical protein